MNIELKNCNNIDSGIIEIKDGALNVKYAINGTGKSTIAKSIDAFVNNDRNKINELLPFKFRNNPNNNVPSIRGIDNVKSVSIFNEEYVGRFIFQENELIKNSFEIFVKSQDYDKNLNEIEKLLNDINNVFRSQPELDDLINTLTSFVDGFGKAKRGYSAAGSIGKGIGKGNKIENIPTGLEMFEPYLKSENTVKWLNWHFEGQNFIDIVKEQCPYCTASMDSTIAAIKMIDKEFDSNSVNHLNKMMNIFIALKPYFSKKTICKVNSIVKNASGLNESQINYLVEIKGQVEILLKNLQSLKNINFNSFKKVEKIYDEILTYKLDVSYFSHLDSDKLREKINIINASLEEVLKKAGLLQGGVAKQKKMIRRTIEEHRAEINDFLKYAGYKYCVDIEDSNDGQYRLILKHNDAKESTIETVHNYLSFGERNAFSLVLFMYDALKKNSDLIILDDPISSFDGNKQYAIINMLFMGKKSFKNRTVLFLTHEFNTIIDIIYNMYRKFSPAPKAAFLTTTNGVLQEKQIEKKDIISYREIAINNMNSSVNDLTKLVYLRRLLELENPKGFGYQLLSNLFHKRKFPEYRISRDSFRLMTEEEVVEANKEIKNYISHFDYKKTYEIIKHDDTLKELYNSSKNNYEKLHIYRIIQNNNHSNNVVRKFINESFHIENDLIFQLNPCDFDTVPQYIIDECNVELFP